MVSERAVDDSGDETGYSEGSRWREPTNIESDGRLMQGEKEREKESSDSDGGSPILGN